MAEAESECFSLITSRAWSSNFRYGLPATAPGITTRSMTPLFSWRPRQATELDGIIP
jgi:hypothetical protein